MKILIKNLNDKVLVKCLRCKNKVEEIKNKLTNENGQGTTEYAILVGVLVVIAIIAIAVFKPKLEELWNAIADGINGL